jgi:hypothetical protein
MGLRQPRDHMLRKRSKRVQHESRAVGTFGVKISRKVLRNLQIHLTTLSAFGIFSKSSY